MSADGVLGVDWGSGDWGIYRERFGRGEALKCLIFPQIDRSSSGAFERLLLGRLRWDYCSCKMK